MRGFNVVNVFMKREGEGNFANEILDWNVGRIVKKKIKGDNVVGRKFH